MIYIDRVRRVSIVGMGALGILYGDFFVGTLGQEQVTFLADNDRAKNYRDYPVYRNGGEWKFQVQDEAVPDSREAARLIPSVIRATALEAVTRAIRNQVGKDTIMLSMLNGINSEEVIGHVLGRERILYCAAQGMDTMRPGNRSTYPHMREIYISIPESEAKEEPLLKKVTDLFDETGLPYTRKADILHCLQCKWMLSVGVNQTVMVAEGTCGAIQKSGKERHMMMGATAEVATLMEKENMQVTGEDLQSYVNLVDTLDPEGIPSIRQDGLAHKWSEVEFFTGTVVQRVEKRGLDVPVNWKLYQRIMEMEKIYQASGMVYIIKGTGARGTPPYGQ